MIKQDDTPDNPVLADMVNAARAINNPPWHDYEYFKKLCDSSGMPRAEKDAALALILEALGL